MCDSTNTTETVDEQSDVGTTAPSKGPIWGAACTAAAGPIVTAIVYIVAEINDPGSQYNVLYLLPVWLAGVPATLLLAVILHVSIARSDHEAETKSGVAWVLGIFVYLPAACMLFAVLAGLAG